MDKGNKQIIMLIFWAFVSLLCATFTVTPIFATEQAKREVVNIDRLISALIQVESRGDDNAIGDVELTCKAYGCLQIRQPCVEDVNRAFGTKYSAQDCLGNRALSIEICEKYLSLYATKKRLNREVTDEDRSRIWNGGPNGFKKASTVQYWQKVEKALKKN